MVGVGGAWVDGARCAIDASGASGAVGVAAAAFVRSMNGGIGPEYGGGTTGLKPRALAEKSVIVGSLACGRRARRSSVRQ